MASSLKQMFPAQPTTSGRTAVFLIRVPAPVPTANNREDNGLRFPAAIRIPGGPQFGRVTWPGPARLAHATLRVMPIIPLRLFPRASVDISRRARQDSSSPITRGPEDPDMRPVAFAALLALLTFPTVLPAGLFCGCGRPNPCATCQPCGQCQSRPCHCSTPPQVHVTPQVQTRPVVSYQDITTTQYRTQAETQTVPVTQFRSVTVDEGNWQQIWVPKLTTKQVPETTYQQQTVYRQVPYQVTQRVPQVSYQSTTHMVQTVTPGMASSCQTCGPTTAWSTGHGHWHGQTAMAPPIITTPYLATQPAPIYSPQTAIAQPVYAQPGYYPQTATNVYQSPGREAEPLRSVFADSPSLALSPDPDPMFANGSSASSGNWTSVQTASPDPVVPEPRDLPPTRVSSASGLFTPAPSASTVWRSRTGSAWR